MMVRFRKGTRLRCSNDVSFNVEVHREPDSTKVRYLTWAFPGSPTGTVCKSGISNLVPGTCGYRTRNLCLGIECHRLGKKRPRHGIATLRYNRKRKWLELSKKQ